MPEPRHPPGAPGDWLARARGDLALARAPLPDGGYLEDLCYHAQPAAEKALKAVHVRHEIVFRYTHDLAELLASIRAAGLKVPPHFDEGGEC